MVKGGRVVRLDSLDMEDWSFIKIIEIFKLQFKWLWMNWKLRKKNSLSSSAIKELLEWCD